MSRRSLLSTVGALTAAVLTGGCRDTGEAEAALTAWLSAQPEVRKPIVENVKAHSPVPDLSRRTVLVATAEAAGTTEPTGLEGLAARFVQYRDEHRDAFDDARLTVNHHDWRLVLTTAPASNDARFELVRRLGHQVGIRHWEIHEDEARRNLTVDTERDRLMDVARLLTSDDVLRRGLSRHARFHAVVASKDVRTSPGLLFDNTLDGMRQLETLEKTAAKHGRSSIFSAQMTEKSRSGVVEFQDRRGVEHFVSDWRSASLPGAESFQAGLKAPRLEWASLPEADQVGELVRVADRPEVEEIGIERGQIHVTVRSDAAGARSVADQLSRIPVRGGAWMRLHLPGNRSATADGPRLVAETNLAASPRSKVIMNLYTTPDSVEIGFSSDDPATYGDGLGELRKAGWPGERLVAIRGTGGVYVRLRSTADGVGRPEGKPAGKNAAALDAWNRSVP